MEYYVLASGSKGNATLIVAKGHGLLIDMGLSLKQFKTQLAETPYTLSQIEAILVTHEHSDHIAGLHFFDSSLIYASKGTYDLADDHLLKAYQTYQIGLFKVTPLATSHDAHNPLGYVIDDGEEKMVYMTDTGYVSERNLKLMKNADYYIFESNHNVRKLLQTNRPYDLKQRILGDEGHLSNEDSALYLSECIGSKTREIVLAHLSEEANAPELALEAYFRIFRQRYIDVDRLVIKLANQHMLVSGGQGVKL